MSLITIILSGVRNLVNLWMSDSEVEQLSNNNIGDYCSLECVLELIFWVLK